jgi:hypothetical protein
MTSTVATESVQFYIQQKNTLQSRYQGLSGFAEGPGIPSGNFASNDSGAASTSQCP